MIYRIAQAALHVHSPLPGKAGLLAFIFTEITSNDLIWPPV